MVSANVHFISLLLLSGCKKYPEGPLISFRSKTERVSNTWKFSNCKINGVDATSDYTGTELDLIKNGTADWKFGNEIGIKRKWPEFLG